MADQWYVARRGQDGNKRYGPVSIRELRDLMDSGKVRGEDLVWSDGMAEWQRADHCSLLAPAAPGRAEPHDYPPDDHGYDHRPGYDDRPQPRRYAVWRKSSGTMVALIVGGVVLLLGFLGCGGGLLYWMLNRTGSAIRSAAATPYTTPTGLGDTLAFGRGELYYTTNVTPSDAQTVGNYLYKTGYFNSDRSALVQLDRDGDGMFVLRCCVQSDKIWDSNVGKGFEDLRAYLADHVLYQPIEIELCDEAWQEQRTISGPID